MRIIVFSDLHLANYKAFSHSQEGYNSRMLTGIDILTQIRTYAVNNGIQNVLFCGDLFDNGSSFSPDLLSQLTIELECWQNAGIFLYGIPGQHDYHALFGKINGLQPFYRDMNIIKHGQIIDVFNGLSITGCWHANTKEKQLEYLAKVYPGNGEYKIFLGHFLVKEILEKNNAPFDATQFVSVNDLPKGFDHYFIGDYHPYVYLPEHKVMSVGLTHQNSFKDANCAGSFIDFDLEMGNFERVYTQAPVFTEISQEDCVPVKLDKEKTFYQIVVKDKRQEDQIRSKMEGFKYRIRYDLEPEQRQNNVRIDNISFSMKPEDVIRKYLDYMNMGDNKELLETGLSFIGEEI